MKRPILIALMAILCLSVKAKQKVDTLQTNNWAYSENTNEMTGLKSYHAEVTDTSSSVVSHITIRNRKGKNDVLFSVDDAVLNMQSFSGINGINMKIKFDDSSISRKGASAASDGDYSVVFLNAANGFIKKIKDSKVLFVEIELYNRGTFTFKFNVENLKWEH